MKYQKEIYKGDSAKLRKATASVEGFTHVRHHYCQKILMQGYSSKELLIDLRH